MATFRGRAVRSGMARGQLDTGQTASAARARAAALERRRPATRGSVRGQASLRKAFPDDRDKVDKVLHAIRILRSNRDSALYVGSKQTFLSNFKATHGVAYPYKVPKRA